LDVAAAPLGSTTVSDPNDHNTGIINEFRANEGVVGGFFEGKPILLLHHTGAKSGVERINPLMYNQDGDNLVIFASKGGDPKHPDWFHNVSANPDVEVEVGTEHYKAKATEATGAKRDELWEKQKSDFPQFAEYEANTERVIPVIVLERTV
jgi:deazaflavin-dependent oxidoreductase (nitroreductase family)